MACPMIVLSHAISDRFLPGLRQFFATSLCQGALEAPRGHLGGTFEVTHPTG